MKLTSQRVDELTQVRVSGVRRGEGRRMERWDASIYRVSKRKGSKNKSLQKASRGDGSQAQVANQMLGQDFLIVSAVSWANSVFCSHFVFCLKGA